MQFTDMSPNSLRIRFDVAKLMYKMDRFAKACHPASRVPGLSIKTGNYIFPWFAENFAHS